MVQRWLSWRLLVEAALVLLVGGILRFAEHRWRDDEEEAAQSKAVLAAKLQRELQQVALQLVQPGKGILAADESIDTIGRRFAVIGVENSYENRRKFRQLLFTTANISRHIAGIIMHEETVHQKDDRGERFVDIIREAGILAGIKLDKGTVQLNGTSEFTTKGLDDLAGRAAVFKSDGCCFAKWRCTYVVSNDTPSRKALRENAKVLARYALISQQAGLVPIIEPEVLCDGAQSLERTQEVTEQVLAEVYKSLHDHGVLLEGTLLKVNMVVPGLHNSQKTDRGRIARATVQALRRTVPAAVPGIVFLSGGQSEIDATANLNEINKLQIGKPWKLSFSYGRALQTSALKKWKTEGRKESQDVFLHRAQLNGLAAEGKYEDKFEKAVM